MYTHLFFRSKSRGIRFQQQIFQGDFLDQALLLKDHTKYQCVQDPPALYEYHYRIELLQITPHSFVRISPLYDNLYTCVHIYCQYSFS